jgi:hypothetical protein
MKKKQLILIVMILCLIIPFIIKECFTEWFHCAAEFSNLSIPFITVISGYIVYCAFQEQQKATKELQTQFKIQNKNEEVAILYSTLNNLIENFKYSTLEVFMVEKDYKYSGAKAFYNMFFDIYCDKKYHNYDEKKLSSNPKIMELLLILELGTTIIDKIDINNTTISKDFIIKLFEFKVFPCFNNDEIKMEKHFCNSCNKTHGLPERIIKKINELRSNQS